MCESDLPWSIEVEIYRVAYTIIGERPSDAQLEWTRRSLRDVFDEAVAACAADGSPYAVNPYAIDTTVPEQR